MMRPRVLVDVDDVLTDFIGPAEREVSELLGRAWTVEELPAHEWRITSVLDSVQRAQLVERTGQPEWVAGLVPCPRAQAGIARLLEIAEVVSVTAAISWAPTRIPWLEQHFGIPKALQIYTQAKHVCAGDVMIDDRPENVIRWAQHNPQGFPILWTTRENCRRDVPLPRSSSWDAIVGLVENLR
jgi:5'(3')-deoxyribonucleotidase